MSAKKESPRTEKESVATNRRARYNYHILETLEAGLCLSGPEVKSLRLKQATMDQSFARVEKGEVFLYGLHIAPYAYTTADRPEPLRTRKLLLKQAEIKRLAGHVSVKGMVLVPLEIYFKRGWAKTVLALAKGKRGPDKRDDIKRRETAREVRRNFREKYKG
ncbi:MAG: SsrA-binding protein SmpB [bacterium]